jgi:putative tricarboxylic transport membrane protein
MTARARDLGLGAALLAIAAFFGHGALGMRYFTSIGPGPGFFPRWLALLLALLGAATLLRALLPRAGAGEPPPEELPGAAGALRVLAMLGAVAFVALAMERIGFAPAMLVASLATMAALGLRDMRVVLPVSLAASFGAHLVFARWLGVPLPAGWLGY